MSQTKKTIFLYNPGGLTEEVLVGSFAVREKEFQTIIGGLKNPDWTKPERHYIVQGGWGSGKTTLLYRIYYEIKNNGTVQPLPCNVAEELPPGVTQAGNTNDLLLDADLGMGGQAQNNKATAAHLIPILFPGEQYRVRNLCELWELLCERLEDVAGFKGITHELKGRLEEEDFESRSFEVIANALKREGKHLVVFLDNVGSLMDKLNKQECARLHEILLTFPDICVIGASATALEHTDGRSSRFFDCFKFIHLNGLNASEGISLLRRLGEVFERPGMLKIIDEQPARVETLRRLTGGVVRTMALLFEICSNDECGNAFTDLGLALDRITPSFKHCVDGLSARQQEVVDAIALCWDAVTTKEIAKKARLEGKVVTAQLKDIEKNRLIEKIEQAGTKNNLYRIRDRFFNIWYLMMYGRQSEKLKVKWLAQFLQSWCGKGDLAERSKRHIAALVKGIYCHKDAYSSAVAGDQAGLAEEAQNQLIGMAGDFFEGVSMLNQLSAPDGALFDDAISYFQLEKYEECLKSLEDITNKDGNVLYFLGLLYHSTLHEPEKSLTYYLMSLDKGYTGALYNLALLYKTEFKDFKKAEEYYLEAIEEGYPDAINNLALLYETDFKDFKKAEEYYLLAIENDSTGAMYNLADLYETVFKDFKKAGEYYLMAIKEEDVDAMYNLALLYESEFKDFKKAETYYRMAAEKGDADAMNNLANLYAIEFKDFSKAEDYYRRAIDKENADAMYNLALLYETESRDFDRAEAYYLMAADKGDADAMNSLAWLYYQQKKSREKAVELAKGALAIEESPAFLYTLTTVLFWDNQIQPAIDCLEKLLADKEFIEQKPGEMMHFLLLLMARKRYHLALKYFQQNELSLKDRLKPVYYALMHFMQDEYPNESQKAGGEVAETVAEVVARVKQLEIDLTSGIVLKEKALAADSESGSVENVLL
ncbi:MAG: tetratricopeptide repeat protein [Planctomycetota bacterium]